MPSTCEELETEVSIKSAKLTPHPGNMAVIGSLDVLAREQHIMGRTREAGVTRKAIYQIKRLPFPIECEKQALTVRGVGPYLAKRIMSVIDKDRTPTEKARAIAMWEEWEEIEKAGKGRGGRPKKSESESEKTAKKRDNNTSALQKGTSIYLYPSYIAMHCLNFLLIFSEISQNKNTCHSSVTDFHRRRI
jgi:hypothetical protein